MARIISASFNDSTDAQRAVDYLRSNGVSENAISIISRRGDDYAARGEVAEHTDDEAKDSGAGALTGLAVGAGAGALLGLGAIAIPGIGPFIAAGALAETLGVVGGTAAAGAVVGGASGALAGALTGYGVSKDEADYHAGEVERGSTYVGVDLDRTNVPRETIEEALRRHNGRFYTAR